MITIRDDHISRIKAIEAVDNEIIYNEAGTAPVFKSVNHKLRKAIENIKLIEASDVRVSPSGKWEVVHGCLTPGGDPYLICPFCHSEESGHLGGIEMPKHWNFCPVCGAKLEESNGYI